MCLISEPSAPALQQRLETRHHYAGSSERTQAPWARDSPRLVLVSHPPTRPALHGRRGALSWQRPFKTPPAVLTWADFPPAGVTTRPFHVILLTPLSV